MKYIVLLGDGMSDYPVPMLGDKTPLQVASKPNIDRLAMHGEVGLVKTIPDTLSPGSDVANLSVMGYDPVEYYTGRSPLEAASMGIDFNKTDTTFRCNLVTLSEGDTYESRLMLDHSSDEISTEEARLLIEQVDNRFKNDFIKFYPGVSYRHCLLWKMGPLDFDLTPPHDILEEPITNYLPKGEHSKIIMDMMMESVKFLSNHPVNLARIEKGLKPANSIWIWGEGRKPSLKMFKDKYGIDGSVISAVDLIKGLGICAGLKSVDVEGATGTIDTNYKGKAEAALDELKSGKDFVYIHVEAPDECGHRNEVQNKVKSIELIDSQVLGTLLKGLEDFEDYKIMILPDHSTPLKLRTHTSDPVPYIIYRKSRQIKNGINGYNEFEAQKSGKLIDTGHKLMDYFLNQ